MVSVIVSLLPDIFVFDDEGWPNDSLGDNDDRQILYVIVFDVCWAISKYAIGSWSGDNEDKWWETWYDNYWNKSLSKISAFGHISLNISTRSSGMAVISISSFVVVSSILVKL